jgi:hypothetical protein
MRSAGSESRERRAGVAVCIALAVPALLFTGQFPPLFNPNELSRQAAIVAFAESGSFAVDRVAPRLGLVEDVSRSGGHLYSNKAPGLTVAALPVYCLLRVFFPPPDRADAPIFVLLRILVVTPVCVLAVARLLAWERKRRALAGSLVAAAVALGTPFLFYARSFFSHAWVAALLFLSLDRIRAGEEAGTWRRVGFRFFLAGVLAGWAAISEYPTALIAGLLLLRCISRRAWTRAGFFALGLALPLAILLAYDAVCFGSPFVLSSARESLPEYADLASHGLFGFGAPKLSVAAAYLFHPARGLILFSPFWIWSFAGFVKWRLRREDRADWAFSLAAVVLFFVAMTAYPNWHGGWSFGNRYLLPILFPAALSLAYALDSPVSRWGFAAAVVFAVAVHEVIAATWVHYPVELVWPAKNGALWFLAHGWAGRGILGASGASRFVAPAASFAAAAVAVGWALAAAGLPRARTAWAAAAGLVAFGAALALSPPLDFALRAFRAEIYGRASGLDPRFQALSTELETATTPAERRRAETYRRRYGLPR